MCVLSELRNSLRSGDIWVTGSLNYQDFERYLLSKSLFKELAQNHDLPLSIAVNYDEYIESRLNLLNTSFDEANSCFKNKSSEDVLIKNGRLSIKPYQGNTIPDEAKSIIREIYNELPKIKITDLLVEVDSWTGFTDQFT
ncbi:MAG: Tn3 family transposase, partial [Lentisphaeraceae bacterium]|nr:Tn3 family transposase [Lentisphaeraceae bacterium]